MRNQETFSVGHRPPYLRSPEAAFNELFKISSELLYNGLPTWAAERKLNLIEQHFLRLAGAVHEDDPSAAAIPSIRDTKTLDGRLLSKRALQMAGRLRRLYPERNLS